MNADTLDLDTIDTDAPLFDPAAFGLGDEEAGLNALARRLGRTRFAPRAAAYDRDARFPTENYTDLGEQRPSRHLHPQGEGGLGAGFRAYCTTAAEIGRYCAATALTWNMHTCTCLWTGALADDLDMAPHEREQHRRRRALHYRRVVAEGALYAQPFSEGGIYDGTARMTPFSTVAQRVAGGWRINGRKIFASLAGAADYYGILCGEAGQGPGSMNRRHAATRCTSRCPPRAGRRGRGRLGSARHARHGLAHHPVQGCLRRRRRHPDAARPLLPGVDALAAHVHKPVADLSRDRPGRLRLHRPLSARRDRRHRWRRSGASRRPSSSRWPRCSSCCSR